VRRARFDGTLAGWRAAARALLAAEVPPHEVLWSGPEETPLLDGLEEEPSAREPALAEAAPARVPRALLERIDGAACFRDPERWALFYRLVWRTARGERHLVRVASDPDVHRLLRMEKAVRREVHKMHAFVRFRAVAAEDGGEPDYVAWFEPEHPVVERAAPFFARRFAAMRWAILTPERCARWDGAALRFGPGLPRAAAPRGDEVEALWRTYYAHTFNPARLRPSAMRAEMPKRFWRNLPEAALIPELVRGAPARVRRMVDGAEPPEGGGASL
jgi:probable DNA metabolism protein